MIDLLNGILFAWMIITLPFRVYLDRIIEKNNPSEIRISLGNGRGGANIFTLLPMLNTKKNKVIGKKRIVFNVLLVGLYILVILKLISFKLHMV